MASYSVGSRVRIVGGGEGIVIEVLAHLTPSSYRVFLSALATPLLSESDLESVETTESDLGALLRRGVYASAHAFRYALTQRRLADQLTDTLLSYNAARIQIQAHQFKPLLKLLDSPYRRLLIADEVGLGKTIEAGIIINEFELRERLDRVLIVCPHALIHKWRDELESKFGMRFEISSGKQLREWLARAEKTGYAEPTRSIVSLEGIRSADITEMLESARVLVDLLVVDEAHHLRNDETQSFALGAALTAASDLVVFLSATPLNLRNRDLFNLVHLLLPDVYADQGTFEAQIAPNQSLNAAIRQLRAGSPNDEVRRTSLAVEASEMSSVFTESDRFRAMLDRLSQPTPLSRDERVHFQRVCMDLNTLDGVLSRTRKADVAPFAVREPYSVHLEFTAAERVFYEAVTAFCVERYSMSGGSGFGAITYQRQLCSCIPAMRELLAAVAADGDCEIEDDEWESENNRRPLSIEEGALLEDAITAAHAVGHEDTKYRHFEKLVTHLLDEQGVERVMVFSFFRRTISYLGRRLGAKYRLGVIMGGMPLDERAAIVDRFKKGEVQILLASEVGGEGLDFQFCNVLVNYDLPWNPMRVEQRIGRLDRYGQQHEKILIYNLLVEDTVEARIFGRLFDRIELFKAAIGDLEAILGDTVNELTKAAMDLQLTEEQQAAKTEQLAQQLLFQKAFVESLTRGKDVLLSNDQYFLDRFGAMQRGGGFLTPWELANFCSEALGRYFPGARITRSGNRWWLRPTVTFAEYVRREVYDAGADGRLHHISHVTQPLVLLRSAAEEDQGIPITFEPEEAFDNRQLELLSAQHPYVQALVRRSQQESLNQFSCARLRLASSEELETGPYVLALYKLHSTGLRPLRRLEAVAVSLTTAKATRMSPEWLGRFIDGLKESELQNAPSDGGAIDVALETADQLLVDVKENEREEIQSRQNDLIQLRVASLEFAFQRKRERLERAIATVSNAAIQRLRRGELANAKARYETQLATLREQKEISVPYDRIAAAILDVV